MGERVRELSSHFRANPLSGLVAVLLVLFLTTVAYFLYHMNIGMRYDALRHDQRQHLQLTGQLVEQRLQRALADVRSIAAHYRADLENGRGLTVAEGLRGLCRQYGDVAGFRVRSERLQAPLEVACSDAVVAGMDKVSPGFSSDAPTAIRRVSGDSYLIDDQMLVIQWRVVGERGELKGEWQLFYSLGRIRDEVAPGHGAPVQTVLVAGVEDWAALRSEFGLGASGELWQQIGRQNLVESPAGLFLTRDVVLRDPVDRSSIASWRLITHVPRTVLDRFRLGFYRDLGVMALIFGLVLVALYLYSRRIIGEQLKMVTELKHKQLFLDRLLDSSPDAMLTLDLNGSVLSHNSRSETLFGYRPGELAGRSVEVLLPSDYQLADQDYRLIYDQLADEAQEFSRRELVGIRVPGDEFPVEVTYCRLKMPEEPRLLLIIREITERKVAEQELDNLRVEYFQQEKVAQIGLLVAGILHEVGNPLAAIEGLLEEVLHLDREREEPSLEAHYQRNLGMVLEQAQRIRSICHEVSGFASPRQSDRGPLSVNQILQSTANLLGYDKRWRGIDLQMHLDPLLPAMDGVADQLTQVFMNLLVNAADAFEGAPPEGARVTVSSRCLGSDMLLVSICDNGGGIPESAMHRIFESFYTTKPRGKGTGLGLSICETLIEEHGGSIEIESREGVGTDVRLYFSCTPPLIG